MDRLTVKSLLIILALCFAFAGNAGAATLNAASCSQSDVQSKVTAAGDGDTVSIPSGSCNWGSTVKWTNKNISVIGAGEGKTVISTSGNKAFHITITNASKGKFRVSGMTIKGVGTNVEAIHLDAGSLAGAVKGWRIDHIYYDFRSGGSEGCIPVLVDGINWGLIDHITYDGGAYGAIMLRGFSANDGWPVKEPGMGSPYWAHETPLRLPVQDEAVYIEDCTWNMPRGGGPSGSYIMAVNDMYYGGKIVFRHNTVTNSYFQSHGARSFDRGGNIWSEIYSNTFNSTDPNWSRAIHLRNGTGVVYNNTFTGYYNSIHVDDQRSCGAATGAPYGACNGGSSYDGNTSGESGWPCLDQIGRGPGAIRNQPSVPLYGWNNGSGAGCATGGSCNNSITITVNNACNSAAHVKTTGSSPAHAGGVLDYVNNGSTPKSGYQAYVYPHPLQGGGNSLQPPTGVRVVN